jgi:hypothetical protein
MCLIDFRFFNNLITYIKALHILIIPLKNKKRENKPYLKKILFTRLKGRGDCVTCDYVSLFFCVFHLDFTSLADLK